MKSKYLGLLALGLLAGPIAVNAVPVSTEIGNVTVDAATYRVALLHDSEGVASGQSFNALAPSITFTNDASARAAAEALLEAFGSAFDWNPGSGSAPLKGVRVPFASDEFRYSFFTIVNLIGDSVNGPFASARDDANAYSFAQFSVVPEPASLTLLGLGLAGLGLSRRRKAA